MEARPELRIRVSVDLKEWLEKRAEEHNRSTSGEVTFRLEEARRREARAAKGRA